MGLAHETKKKSIRDNYFLKAFFLGLGLSFLVFLPFIVVDGGRFLFYGDFNVQQVPFYRLAHDAVRSGNLGWSHLTDLGANFIGSYSFYLLGSPFFWLTIPFPSEWVQFLMGPLLILKFACATLTGYVYIHRYTKSKDTALIGAVLYAFPGSPFTTSSSTTSTRPLSSSPCCWQPWMSIWPPGGGACLPWQCAPAAWSTTTSLWGRSPLP